MEDYRKFSPFAVRTDLRVNDPHQLIPLIIYPAACAKSS